MDTASRPPWRKSTYSNSSSNCLEAAHVPGAVAVRDTKDPAGPRLASQPNAGRRSLAALRGCRAIRPITPWDVFYISNGDVSQPPHTAARPTDELSPRQEYRAGGEAETVRRAPALGCPRQPLNWLALDRGVLCAEVVSPVWRHPRSRL